MFLDINGVLHIKGAGINEIDGENDFDKGCVERLNAIVKETDTFIVISSSWRSRNLDWIRTVFTNRGFNYPEKIIGETMRGYHFIEKGVHFPVNRGTEIKAWLEKFVEGPGFKNKDYVYLIFDNSRDMLLSQKDNFIKINSYRGIRDEDVYIALSILNK